jgi:hypothetical protein
MDKPMLKRAVLISWVAFSAVLLWGQSRVQIDPKSQPAVNELAAVANAIKECPRELKSEKKWGKKPTEISRWYIGPPQNVIWDVIPSTSVRSPYAAAIEFSLEYKQWLPDDVKDKYKDPFGLDFLLLSQGPVKRRYEFDLGPGGLQLTRMLFGKTELIDESPDDACWQKAARNVQAIPTSAVSPQTTQIASIINVTPIIGFRGDAFLIQCDTDDDIKKEACKLWLSGLEAGLTAAGFIVDANAGEATKVSQACLPKLTTEDQLFSLILKYIKNHRSYANKSTAFLYLLALQEAFPCRQ